MRDGSRRVIAAWQMADPDIVALDWQSACAEWLGRRITKRGL